VAIGAGYAGKCAFTITSGPGMALKTEFIGLATMIEVPLVVVDVQRGGPSTGLPTKVEQSDLLAALFGQPGDTPKVVLAPATIEECFHVMITARRIADAFRLPVIVLSDANLATGVQPFPRPEMDPAWFAQAPDQSPVRAGLRPFDWDPSTGLSERFIPGRPGGMHIVTGLHHDQSGRLTYDQQMYQHGSAMRARKLAVLQQMLQPPAVHGPDEGDLLLVGWGSTKGAIEEAVDRARVQGLKALFSRFRRVMTVEINYSDDPAAPYITEENRRRGQLSWLLRAVTLVDVDCWTRVLGEPLRPGVLVDVIRANIEGGAR
jgi:2-oxoglutarate ferredoxin oxidoreductase subunit alpha